MKHQLKVIRTTCCLLIFIVNQSGWASKPVPPPDRDALLGAWIGYDQDRLIFCRLELYKDGTGAASTCYLDDPAQLYLVTRWTLDGFKLEVNLTAVDKDAEA